MTQLRLAPSGPPIENAQGGPLDFGPGARLRLTESQVTMGGSTAILAAAAPAAETVVSADGFGAPAINNPLLASLSSPKPNLSYRANLRLDVTNIDPSTLGSVLFLLDTSIDGGANWTNQIQTIHFIYPNTYIDGEVTEAGMTRQMEVTMTTRTGTALGVLATTSSLLVRVRLQAITGPTDLLVTSPATSGELTDLDGSIHLWLEEVF